MTSSTVTHASLQKLAELSLCSTFIERPPFHYVGTMDVPHNFATGTLWRRSPGALIGASAPADASSRFVAWADLEATIVPGPGSMGRFIILTVAWGNSLEPPGSRKAVAALAPSGSSATIGFGGMSDPDHATRTKKWNPVTSPASALLKPSDLRDRVGYPVLYIWVEHGAGAAPVQGTLFNVQFSGEILAIGTPARTT